MPGTAEIFDQSKIDRPSVVSQSASPGSVSSRPFEAWSWVTELIVLVFLALLLRGFAVWKTPVITKDGLIYLGIARTIDHGMWLELVGDWFLFNPYPAAIAWWARQGMDFELAGQWLNAIASGLTVIPLYLWCRSAFDRRIAQLTALTFIFHPIVVRVSGQVLREGLYWNLMCWAIYAYWMAAQRGSWWRYVLAGLFTTTAALTRMEGAVVFLLGGLWTLTCVANRRTGANSGLAAPESNGTKHRARFAWIGSGLLWGLSLAVFPLTLILLNVVFVPVGHGWQGCGRWVQFAVSTLTGKQVVATQKPPPARMSLLVDLERQRQTSEQSRPSNIRELAKSLPIWNSLGEADVAQLRMQRFLVLAEDQRRFIFFGRFCHECIDGLLFPCVICCFWGLYFGRKSEWRSARDWPLAVYTGVLICLLMSHLAREYVLEPRYMLCLMPFVFTWSCIGARLMHYHACEWFQNRPAYAWRPSTAFVTVALIVVACGKLWIGLDDKSKLSQREVGTQLRHDFPYRLKIAGPESLRRVGHYADADYVIIPVGETKDIEHWLRQLPIDFVVLAKNEPCSISGEQLQADENKDRYRLMPSGEKTNQAIQVFSVRPPIRQVGS